MKTNNQLSVSEKMDLALMKYEEMVNKLLLPDHNPITPDEVFKYWESGYVEILDMLKQVANIYEPVFLSTDFAKIKEDNPLTYFQYIRYFSNIFKFFPNDKIVSKMEELGFKKGNLLRWFIPVETILIEIEEIKKNKGVTLFPNIALNFIITHLDYQILNEILLWEGYSTTKIKNGKKPYNLVHAELFKSINKRKKGNTGKSIKGNDFANATNDELNKFENSLPPNRKKELNTILEVSQGKTKKNILNDLFNSIKFDKTYGKGECYLIASKLLVLLMKEITIKTEGDFTKSYKENNSYGNNYNKYLVHTLEYHLNSRGIQK